MFNMIQDLHLNVLCRDMSNCSLHDLNWMSLVFFLMVGLAVGIGLGTIAEVAKQSIGGGKRSGRSQQSYSGFLILWVPFLCLVTGTLDLFKKGILAEILPKLYRS